MTSREGFGSHEANKT